MHVQLPKPLHGWRAFVGEVGIIVLGVLIALGAGSVVEDWQWRHKVAIVRASLMGELGNDRARWEVDQSFVPCARREIDLLDQWAAKGGASAPPPATPLTHRGYFWWLHWANWNLATGSQTLDHFPVREQLEMAALYDGIIHRQSEIVSSADLEEEAASLIPLATDAQGRRELRAVLGKLRGKIDALVGDDAYMERHFKDLGVKADDRDFAADLKATFRCRA